jgi:hypothetical protein
LLSLTFVASGAEPVAGTWKLNPSKSKYSPGPAAKSATFTYEETANGIRRTGETINDDGTRTSFEYAAKYDGADYPVKGWDVVDAISLKRVNERTTEATLKKSGKEVRTARRVLSEDGKTLTITSTGTNEKGQKFKNVAVYNKQ